MLVLVRFLHLLPVTWCRALDVVQTTSTAQLFEADCAFSTEGKVGNAKSIEICNGVGTCVAAPKKSYIDGMASPLSSPLSPYLSVTSTTMCINCRRDNSSHYNVGYKCQYPTQAIQFDQNADGPREKVKARHHSLMNRAVTINYSTTRQSNETMRNKDETNSAGYVLLRIPFDEMIANDKLNSLLKRSLTLRLRRLFRNSSNNFFHFYSFFDVFFWCTNGDDLHHAADRQQYHHLIDLFLGDISKAIARFSSPIIKDYYFSEYEDGVSSRKKANSKLERRPSETNIRVCEDMSHMIIARVRDIVFNDNSDAGGKVKDNEFNKASASSSVNLLSAQQCRVFHRPSFYVMVALRTVDGGSIVTNEPNHWMLSVSTGSTLALEGRDWHEAQGYTQAIAIIATLVAFSFLIGFVVVWFLLTKFL